MQRVSPAILTTLKNANRVTPVTTDRVILASQWLVFRKQVNVHVSWDSLLLVDLVQKSALGNAFRVMPASTYLNNSKDTAQ